MSLERTLSYQFIQKTKLSFTTFGVREIYLESAPPYKSYPQVEKIELKLRDIPEKGNFFQILSKRRSNRKYRKMPLSLEEISLLCFAAQGITAQAGFIS